MNILGFDVPVFVFGILAAALAFWWATAMTARLQKAEDAGERLEEAPHQDTVSRHIIRTRYDMRFACVLLSGVLMLLSAILAVLLIKL